MLRSQLAAHTILTKSIRARTTPLPVLPSTTTTTTSSKWPTPTGNTSVIVVHDKEPCQLAQNLLDGYRSFFESQPGSQQKYSGSFVTFSPDSFFEAMRSQAMPGGTVVLVQNHAFQNEMKAGSYRLRLPLFEMGLRVVEHPHLVFATTPVDLAPMRREHDADSASAAAASRSFSPPSLDQMCENYINACCADPDETDTEARRIGDKLDSLTNGGAVVECKSGRKLTFAGPLEKCLYNTGKFFLEGTNVECPGSAPVGAASAPTTSSSQLQQQTRSNIGGSFPFGEVISESVVLSHLSGECDICAFPSIRRTMALAAEPFRVTINKGKIVDICRRAPQDFVDLLNIVKEAEGEVCVRELGIGLNRSLGVTSGGKLMVGDVTSFERQFGVHLSLGKRHPLFPKNAERVKAANGGNDSSLQPYDLLKRKAGKFHLDVFLDVSRLSCGSGEVIVDFSSA